MHIEYYYCKALNSVLPKRNELAYKIVNTRNVILNQLILEYLECLILSLFVYILCIQKLTN